MNLVSEKVNFKFIASWTREIRKLITLNPGGQQSGKCLCTVINELKSSLFATNQLCNFHLASTLHCHLQPYYSLELCTKYANDNYS